MHCAAQIVSGLAGWHDEPRASNAKWYIEWKGTEWRDLVLADLVRQTLEGLILACFDDAEGIVDCVDTRTDGKRILEVKDTLKVRHCVFRTGSSLFSSSGRYGNFGSFGKCV